MIEILPLSWKDFKNYLKHKRKEMSLEDLIVRLRIEEDNRGSEKKNGRNLIDAKANVVEQKPKHNSKKRKYPGESSKRSSGSKTSEIQNFTGKCYVCNKQGHRAKDCYKRRTQRTMKKYSAQANISEEVYLCAMISG